MKAQWHRRLGWIVVAVIAADWLTKFLVLNRIALHHQVEVLENLLYLVHRQNRGIAFGIMNEGMAHWRLPLLLVLGVVATAMLVQLARTIRDARSLAGLGLVLGGAIGNLGDRALNGHVTDFILVSFFPFIFNVADIALTLGAIVLGIGLLRERQPPAGSAA